MTCKILFPDHSLVYEGIASATLPGLQGQFQILPGHAESFQLLAKGIVLLKKEGGGTEKKEIISGACHFRDDVLTVNV